MATDDNPGLGERIYPPRWQDQAGNFWINDNGVNTLKGVPDDETNPPRLPDFHILNALQRTQKAQDDFNKMLPSLLPEEQERLNTLTDDNPFLTKLISDETITGDEVQKTFNTIPVYFAGRFRGGGPRRNVIKNTYPVTDED